MQRCFIPEAKELLLSVILHQGPLGQPLPANIKIQDFIEWIYDIVQLGYKP